VDDLVVGILGEIDGGKLGSDFGDIDKIALGVAASGDIVGVDGLNLVCRIALGNEGSSRAGKGTAGPGGADTDHVALCFMSETSQNPEARPKRKKSGRNRTLLGLGVAELASSDLKGSRLARVRQGIGGELGSVILHNHAQGGARRRSSIIVLPAKLNRGGSRPIS